MNNGTEAWQVRAQRVHGRLAITYWPRHPNGEPATGVSQREIVELDYDTGRAIVSKKDNRPSQLRLLIHNGAQRAWWQLRLGQGDWQGVLEGYYQPEGTLAPGGVKAVWVGRHCIKRRGLNGAEWERLCLGISRLLDHLRWDKEKVSRLLPIGRYWGLLNLREYLATRWKLLLGRTVERPFGSRLHPHENFGYQVLQSPQTSWRETRGRHLAQRLLLRAGEGVLGLASGRSTSGRACSWLRSDWGADFGSGVIQVLGIVTHRMAKAAHGRMGQGGAEETSWHGGSILAICRTRPTTPIPALGPRWSWIATKLVIW